MTDSELLKQQITKAWGEHYSKLDTFVLEYFVSIFKDFDDDKKELKLSISPFLDDIEVDEEDQIDILNSLWESLRGNGDGANAKKQTHKLLDAPVNLQILSQGIDKEVAKKSKPLEVQPVIEFSNASRCKRIASKKVKTRKSETP
jgi:hypothetical protein